MRPRKYLWLGLIGIVGCAAGAERVPNGSAPRAPASAATSSAKTNPKIEVPAGWPYEPPAPAMFAHGAVTTDADIATRVGVDILRAGGNAIDAAVATAFALAVAYPTAGNIGGGGFLVARVDQKFHALDFREVAPAAASRDMYASPEAQKAGASRTGYLSAAVPGSVAGLWEAHRTLGSKKKTWAELVMPAIKLAEEGFVASEEFSRSIAQVQERLKKYPASAALFLPNGEPVKAGAKWNNPELAVVLRRIAEQGPPGFYQGPSADALVADMKANGGIITQADLAGYRAKWRKPIEFSYRGHRVVSMPPPSSGGVTVGMIAHILESYDLGSMGFYSPSHIHYVAEAMRRSFIARNARLGDPDFVTNPVDELMSPAWATAQRATIKVDRATPTSELAPLPASGTGPHTTHFSVIDSSGNAVALTTTINFFFGSGVTVKGAGYVLNNEMDDFATVPGNANGFGLVQGEPNAIAPHKRMLSSMAPTLVFAPNGELELVVGAAGGPTIISAVFQILSNVVDYKMPVGQAVSAPRIHHQGLPDMLLHEAKGMPAALKSSLETMGYTFKEREHVADAPGLGWTKAGIVGAPEPRRSGSTAFGY